MELLQRPLYIKQTNKMKLLLAFAIGLLSISCKSDRRTIIFINQSNEKIDSITVAVASATLFSKKHFQIKPNDTIITHIPANTPVSNRHDISVEVTVFVHHQPPVYIQNYNDLTGTLDHDFSFVFTKQKEIKLLIVETKNKYL